MIVHGRSRAEFGLVHKLNNASMFYVFIIEGTVTPAKIDLKMPSAIVVYCIFLLTLFDLCKYGGKQYGPSSDCSSRPTLSKS